MTDRTPQHAEHDPFLIALAAADDLRPTERLRATDLLESCRDCAALAADLRGLATATAALPPRRAPRDFRLTDADAARLRRGAWRRRFGFLGSPRLAFVQPLGLGVATLGLVGVLLSGTTLPFGGSAASAPGPQGVQAPAGGAAGDTAAAPEDGSGTTNRTGAETTIGGVPESPGFDAMTVASPEPPAASPAPLPMAGATSDPSDSSTILAAPVGASPAPAVPAPDPSTGKAGASPAEQAATGVSDGGEQPVAESTGADTDVGAGVAATGQPTPEGGSSWSGWLALLVAGLALAAIRPVARLVSRG